MLIKYNVLDSAEHIDHMGAFSRNVPSNVQAVNTSSHIMDTLAVSWQPRIHNEYAY